MILSEAKILSEVDNVKRKLCIMECTPKNPFSSFKHREAQGHCKGKVSCII